MKQATICFCVRDNEILLGLKKIRFGAGKWNGFGGKVDAGESVHEAAARELFEESSIATDPATLEKMAVLDFYFGETPIFECHIFIARTWHNEPQESDEMTPQWFSLDAIPYDDMWDDDKHWLPRILAGERFTGTVVFDSEGKKVQTMDYQPAHF